MIRPLNTTNNDNDLFITILFLAFLIPWIRGGEILWQYLIFATAIFILLAIYSFRAFFFRRPHSENHAAIGEIRLPIYLFVSCIILSFLQNIDLPIQLVEFLSPTSVQVRQDFLPSINARQTLALPLSGSPAVSMLEGIKQCSYLCFFFLTFMLLTSKRRIILLSTTMFLTSAVIAVYSIINFNTGDSIELMSPLTPWDFYPSNIIHGTFSYKNHYASFLTLTIPLGFGLISIGEKRKKGDLRIEILDFLLSKNVLFFLFSMLMLIVLLLNSSRAGNAALCLSTAVPFTYLLFLKRKKTKIAALFTFALSIGLIVVTIILSGISDELVSRFENDSDNGRAQLRISAISVFEDYPLLGSGAGTYPVIHKQYKTPLLNGSVMWQRVHNDYLELLSSQGLVGFTLLGLTIFLLMIKLLSGLKSSSNRMYGIQVACFVSALSILLHSAADFNFQLPANTLYFYMILAIGLKIPLIRNLQKTNIDLNSLQKK